MPQWGFAASQWLAAIQARPRSGMTKLWLTASAADAGGDGRHDGVDALMGRHQGQGVVHRGAGVQVALGVEIAALRDLQPIIGKKARLQVIQRLVGHQAQCDDHRLAGHGPLAQLELQAHGPIIPRHAETAETRSVGPGFRTGCRPHRRHRCPRHGA